MTLLLEQRKRSDRSRHDSDSSVRVGRDRGALLEVQRNAGNQAIQSLLRAGLLQPKLTIGPVEDPFEREADEMASDIVGGPSSREGLAKSRPTGNLPQLRSLYAGVSSTVPGAFGQALQSAGKPLDSATRAFFEPRFGYDFSHVRIYTGSEAAESARSIQAHAYTAGSDIVFDRGQFSPHSSKGRSLLAHELTHVVQQSNAGNAPPRIQRFAASERSDVAPTYSDLLQYIRKLIDGASTSSWLGDELNMSEFVKSAGGRDAMDQIDKKLHSLKPKKNPLSPRYLFTCRCGLIDMLHFIQLFYISTFVSGFEGTTAAGANRYATNKGRQHELDAESNSRFGAEDTPSNALGALSGTGLAARPGPDAVYDAMKDTLDRCSPIDWSTVSKTSQDAIVHFYSDMVPDPAPRTHEDKVIPKNQEQTAIPAILNLPECGGKERSLPFRIDTSDPDRKTLAGRDFLAGSPGIKKGKEAKSFVNTQRPEIIRNLPLSEKIRLLNILLDPPVDDDDLAAARVIYNNSTSAEIVAEPPTGK